MLTCAPSVDTPVRVVGRDAYFVTLGRELQDDIVAREAHLA